MKQLQDIDFRAAYGPVPDGFSRSVQQALHQTKEEPMKKFTLRTAVMAVVTVLVLTAVAFAANEVINPTVVPTPITQFQPVDSGEGTQEEISPSPMATRRPVPDFDEVIPFRAEPSDCNGLRLEIIDATYENGFLKGTWKISTRTPDSSFIWKSTNQQINNVVFLDHTETEEFSGHYLLRLKRRAWSFRYHLDNDARDWRFQREQAVLRHVLLRNLQAYCRGRQRALPLLRPLFANHSGHI